MKKILIMTTLLATIFSSVFAMEKRAARAHYPFVEQLLKGDVKMIDQTLEQKNEKLFSTYYITPDNKTVRADEVPPGSVAVIPIKGTILKDDWCGKPGSTSIASMIRQADRSENTLGTLLYYDTGGGEAAGLETVANSIKSTVKPIVSFIDTYAASAGYFTSSQTDEIIMSEKSAMVGSIGTMVTIWDDVKYWENKGIKIHEIYSSLSPDKNDIWFQALEGNYKPMQEQLLDPHVRIFHSHVKEARGSKLDLDKENVLTGKMYFSGDAISNGLADKIGSFDFAIERIHQLSKEIKISFS